MSGQRTNRAAGLLAVGLFLGVGLALAMADEPAGRVEVAACDAPPLFTYLSWDGKPVVQGGALVIRSEDDKGGLGYNIESDFSAHADWCPAIELSVGPGHKAPTLKLLMRSEGETESNWLFSLEGLKPGATTLVTPIEGASLQQPSSMGDQGGADPANIKQWQIGGTWTGQPVDLRIESIALVAPTPAIVADRAKQAERRRAEAQTRQAEQEALTARYKPGQATSPTVDRISAVAPDVLCLDIQAGRFVPGGLRPDQAQPGDERIEKKSADGTIESVILKREGAEIGWLIGPNREWLTPYEHVEGDPLLEFLADEAASYLVSSTDDPGFGPAVAPASVSRKSRPNAWARGTNELAVLHRVFLKLPRPLAPGRNYTIGLGPINTARAQATFAFDPASVRSEAVHVQQIGYRPDDPVKRAFVSCWMGTRGGLALPEEMAFHLVDDPSGRVVYSGRVERHFPADRIERMAREANFNGTDVARAEFSDFTTPGRYRIVVDGIGCSYPFEIGPNVWTRAFVTQMRGLLNNRSGMELGPPYTTFRKPRDMHPADGYPVTRSRYRAVEQGGEAFERLASADTGEPVAGGWGAYHDAGDWNPRRVTHMQANMASLELLELFPPSMAGLDLNIPEETGLPDILSEAVWAFSCFQRLQQDDGGVGYGIESKGDPLPGEVSWLNSFASYVQKADYAASWYHAAVGARLARLIEPYDTRRAADYRASVLRAFDFAESDYARDKAAGLTQSRGNTWQALDHRNLAAIELYRLTGEKRYHDIFLEDSALQEEDPELFAWGKHIQREQAFVYARLPESLGDPKLKLKAVAAIEKLAARSLAYAAENAFNLTTPDKGKPQFIGFYTTADAADLVRAHFLTGKPEYLAGAIQATQFQAGCNPNNLVYTSGLGANPIRNPFHLDARHTNQPVPEGLTPYGNVDFNRWNDNGIIWPIIWILGKATVPSAYAWPTHEAYWDLGGWPMLEEFTVDAWAPNILVWGYLSARP